MFGGWRRGVGMALAVCAASSAVVTMTGCPEEPPPAPAPPPPPPPPPPAADYSSLIQETADPRVQIAAEVESPEEELAKQVVKLADAIAKGDDAQMNEVLSAPSQALLESMVFDGSWADGTSDIEAVRIIAAGDNIAPPAPPPGKWGPLTVMLDGGTISDKLPDDVETELKATFDDLLKNKEFMDWMKDNVDELIGSLDRDIRNMASTETLNIFKRGLDETKQLATFQDKLKKALGEHYTPPTGEVRRYGVLMAVQTPKGAQLMGWDGVEVEGKGWVFTNVPVNDAVRARASDFDSVGASGFLTEGLKEAAKAGEAPKDEEEMKKQAADNGEAPAEDEKKDENPDDDGPVKKRTPHGPITIPGT